jgi:hypothetical protein
LVAELLQKEAGFGQADCPVERRILRMVEQSVKSRAEWGVVFSAYPMKNPAVVGWVLVRNPRIGAGAKGSSENGAGSGE